MPIHLDQCQPPNDSPGLLGQLNNNGAMCFQFTCQYANLTLGEACEVENIVYIGYSTGGQQNINIVSRDRCAPKLWCNAQASPPQCQPVAKLGEQCIAHKQCETVSSGYMLSSDINELTDSHPYFSTPATRTTSAQIHQAHH